MTEFTRVRGGDRVRAGHINELQEAIEQGIGGGGLTEGEVETIVTDTLTSEGVTAAVTRTDPALTGEAGQVLAVGANGPEWVRGETVEHTFFDDFSRPDQLAIGMAPTGHLWTDYHSTNTSSIVDGKMTFLMSGTPTEKATYPGVTLSDTPSEITARISFEGTADTSPNLFHSCTFIISSGVGGFVAGHPVNMFHCNVTPTHIALNCWESNVSSPQFLLRYYDDALALDGTVYEVRIRFDPDNDVYTILGPDGVVDTIYEPRLTALIGPICIFEPFYNGHTPPPGYIPYFNAVSATVAQPDAPDPALLPYYEPTTNLAGNPSFEVDVTDDIVKNLSTETVSRITDGSATDGTAHLRLVTPGASAYEGVHLFTDLDSLPLGLTGAADPYVASADVWGSGTAEYRMSVTYASGGGTYNGQRKAVVLSGSPQRIETLPITLDPAKTVDSLRLTVDVGNTTSVITVNIDAVQIEQGTRATPYASPEAGRRLQLLTPDGTPVYLSVNADGDNVTLNGTELATGGGGGGGVERPAWPTGAWMGTLFQRGTGATGTKSIPANQLWGGVLDVPQDTDIDRIGVEVTTGATGNLKFAAYAVNADGSAGALLFQAGPVATTATTGMYSATISETLPAGYVYLAVVSDVGVTVRATNGTAGSFGILGSADGTVAGRHSGFVKVSSYTIPDPLGTPTSTAVTDEPNVVIRTA